MPSPGSQHVMACMEVWGGNSAIDTSVVMPGLDAWVYSRPFQAQNDTDAGGDIHYLTSCATGQITRMIVADVSGHGAPVARAADALRRLMRKHSNSIDQSRLMEGVNAQFGQIVEQAADEASSGTLFATAVVATYFAPTDELAISNAGHPRPMHYDARRQRWNVVEHDEAGATHEHPSNLPLGIVEETRYPTAKVQLGADDLVLFYTDSLIEAKDAEGRLLGHEGLRRLLGECDISTPHSLISGLLDRIVAESGAGRDQVFNDDVTTLLVRPNAHKPRPSIGLATLGAIRIMREALRAITPGGLPAALPPLSTRSRLGSIVRRTSRKSSTPGG